MDKLKRGMLQIVTKTLNKAELVIIQCTFYELFVEYDLRSKKKTLVLCFQRVAETRVKVLENSDVVGTRAVMGECFRIFFEFSQTFSIKQLDYELEINLMGY